MTLAHVLETIKFSLKYHQNRPSRSGCRAVTDRQTHTHIHTQTDRQPGSIVTQAVKIIEYKKQVHLLEINISVASSLTFNMTLTLTSDNFIV